MKRITPRETGYSIWVSDIAVNDAQTQPALHEVTEAESAHIPFTREPMLTPHQHDDHEIVVIIHGSGRVTLENGTVLQATTGQIIAIPGGIAHRLDVEGHITLRGLYIHPEVYRLFGPDADDAIVERLASTDRPLAARVVADAHLFSSLQELFEQSQAEFARDDTWRLPYLQTTARLVAIILLRLMQLNESSLHPDPTSRRVQKVKAWMDRHFLDQTPLTELAEMAHLSSSQFSALFRHLYGVPPKAYLIQRRLTQAASLLAQTELSVTDIASGVGFSHLAHFGRLFREHSGLTPREYRKKYQKDQQNLLD